MRLRRLQLVLQLVVAFGFPASGLAGGVLGVTIVASEGDSAGTVGRITSIDNVAVNNAGTSLVEVDTDFADTNSDGVLLRNGAPYLRENDALAAPPNSHLDTFDSINLNNAGHSGWNFFLSGTSGINDDSGIYRDADLVLQESHVSSSPVFSPGTRYIGFFDAKINDANQIFVVASVEDTAITSTVDRALVRLELSGSSLVSETVLAKEGDLLAGQTQAVADFGTGPHQSAFNAAGDALYFVDLAGPTTTDGAIYRNTTLLAQEGGPSPVAGRNYESLASRGLDLNDSGQYVFKANLDGATTDDELVVVNGTVLIREGDTLPAIGTAHFTAFGTGAGPVRIDNQGHVLWWGDWDNPDLDKDTGLFLDDQLIVAEAATIQGQILDEIASGEDAFDISDDGHWILFEGTLAGGLNAAFLVEVDQTTATVTLPRPVSSRLEAVFESPADGSVRVRYSVGLAAQPVRLAIHDVRGRTLWSTSHAAAEARTYEARWDRLDAAGGRVPRGVYFVRLQAGDVEASRKLLLARP